VLAARLNEVMVGRQRQARIATLMRASGSGAPRPRVFAAAIVGSPCCRAQTFGAGPFWTSTTGVSLRDRDRLFEATDLHLGHHRQRLRPTVSAIPSRLDRAETGSVKVRELVPGVRSTIRY